MEVFKITLVINTIAKDKSEASLFVEDLLTNRGRIFPSTVEWDYAIQQTTGFDNPEHKIYCGFCNQSSSEEEAREAGWIPSYWQGEHEMLAPVCPRCIGMHLVLEEGEWTVKAI
jgi:hypothetical protein